MRFLSFEFRVSDFLELECRCLNTLTNVFDMNKRLSTILRPFLKALQPFIWGFPSVSQRDIYIMYDLPIHTLWQFKLYFL